MQASLNVKGSGFLLLALLILTVPLKWLLSAVIAAAFHEFCHILMIRALGGQVLGVTVGAGGAIIEHSPLPSQKTLLCAFAGPLGSIVLVCFFRKIPRIALCAGFHAVFNLLPLFPLDGGRILRTIFEIFLPADHADFIYTIFERITVTGLLSIAVICVLWFDLGFLPLILAGTMVIKGVLRKIPCKETKLNVQ